MTTVTSAAEFSRMEEFRSNLLLLLQCGYPEGLPMNQLKIEYKQYFSEDVAPELILPRNFKNNKHWDTLFQMKEFREDFTLFYMGTAVYIKAIRKRNSMEMKLIAQLAKHSHLMHVKKGEFRCNCCSPDNWRVISKELGYGGGGVCVTPAVGGIVEIGQAPQVEDIIVKIEPHQMMVNGDEDGDRVGGGQQHVTSDGNIYSIVHGNPNNYANGGNGVHDPSSSTSTNDGFMLDHQLRVQEQSSQGQLQAFASLLNSSASGGTIPSGDAGGNGNQPFYTFVLTQNGDIKVMQVISSSTDGAGASGTTSNEVDVPTSSTPTQASPSTPVVAVKKTANRKSAPPPPPPEVKVIASPGLDGYVCSMPGCGESFGVKQLLQNHERTCGMKKYPCVFPGCDRRFKNSKQRHAHMTSRHKGTENNFRCTVPACTAVFKTMDRLKVHESRCRFKYEQFQLMDEESAASTNALNNNNTSFQPSNHSSVVSIMNSSSESMDTQPPSEPNAAFVQAPTIIERIGPLSTVQTHPGTIQIKLENGFSTVDLSLVKSEISE